LNSQRKTCALVIRGGVSPIDRQYRSIRKQPVGIEKVSISAVRESLHRNLQECNPDWDFDIFLFSWDLDLEPEFKRLYDLKKSTFETNAGHRTKIWYLVLRSWINALVYDIEAFRKKVANLKASLAQDFSGISQSISIAKATKLVEDELAVNNAGYDLVALIRPDVVLLEQVDLDSYDPTNVTCNSFKDRQGDFRWVFGSQYLVDFQSLPDHFRHRGVHQPHTWIRDYFDSKGLPYEMDLIQAGSGEEVLRKTRANGIAFAELEKFGLLESEFNRYPK
jgi:hypothetical protein